MKVMSRDKINLSRDENCLLRLQLHGAIYRPDSFVLMLRYCVNLKAIRYESTSLNRIVANKSHRVIVALLGVSTCRGTSFECLRHIPLPGDKVRLTQV